jgi:hypothetical protein
MGVKHRVGESAMHWSCVRCLAVPLVTLPLAVVGALSILTPAHSQTDGAPAEGYDVRSSQQSVQPAPPGWVGRKTTDTETRVGNTEATRGRERRSTLTVGTFVKDCPTAEGHVEGNFEYSLTVDDVISEGQELRREHYTQLLSAELTGHVRDDAHLDYVEYVARFTRTDRDVQSAPVVDRGRFTPGVDGSGDFSAMLRAVEKTSQIAFAMAIWLESPVYRAAEVEWRGGKCVEFRFDPATETVALAPSEAKQVLAELRTKATGEAVPWTSTGVNTIEGIGAVAPSSVDAQADDVATLTYTASDRPRRGNGFRIEAESRAGVGVGAWSIVDPARFEGTFTQTETQPQGGNTGAGSFKIEQTTTIKGRLVWTREEDQLQDGDLPHLPSYGDVASVFYVPTDGEISVELLYEAKGFNAVCRFEGSQVFPISALPPLALGYLVLEVAADGRYKLSLGMLAGTLPTPVDNKGCRMRPIPVPLGVDAVWRDAAIVIGRHEGVLADGHIGGELSPPIVLGPSTTTGRWSFSKVEE